MAKDLVSRTKLSLTRYLETIDGKGRFSIQITQRISDLNKSRESLGIDDIFQAIFLTREEAGELAKDLKDFSEMKEIEINPYC